MTPRKAPGKTAKHPWTAFRANARSHLQDAENKLVRLEPGASAKGIAADAVLAAIAYGDALTVQRLQRHNTQDHGSLPVLVAQALGKRADQVQVTRLQRIVERKNEAHYGGTSWTRDQAAAYLEQVQRFRLWAEQVLAERE
jgi:hypothetical protein